MSFTCPIVAQSHYQGKVHAKNLRMKSVDFKIPGQYEVFPNSPTVFLLMNLVKYYIMIYLFLEQLPLKILHHQQPCRKRCQLRTPAPLWRRVTATEPTQPASAPSVRHRLTTRWWPNNIMWAKGIASSLPSRSWWRPTARPQHQVPARQPTTSPCKSKNRRYT